MSQYRLKNPAMAYQRQPGVEIPGVEVYNNGDPADPTEWWVYECRNDKHSDVTLDPGDWIVIQDDTIAVYADEFFHKYWEKV